MNFYIIVNGQQQGPFSLDELKEKGIQKDTLVWSEGMSDWQQAGDVIELKSLFGVTPPPLSQRTPSNNEQKTNFGNQTLLAVIAIVILIAVIVIVCVFWGSFILNGLIAIGVIILIISIISNLGS
ncbi:DUF4339 domain-containing protein [Dysgonomonas reticulitermitis]